MLQAHAAILEQAMRNTNGIFLGPIGSLEFEGRFSWKNRILAFLYEKLIIKVGPLGPFTINIEKKEDAGRTPGNADPLFVWFYADDEILVGKGRNGGVAFWCRCARVPQWGWHSLSTSFWISRPGDVYHKRSIWWIKYCTITVDGALFSRIVGSPLVWWIQGQEFLWWQCLVTCIVIHRPSSTITDYSLRYL